MQETKYFRAGDQSNPAHAEEGSSSSVDLSPFIGTWVNTKKDTSGFVKLVVSNRDGRLILRTFGASSPEPSDWGETEAHAYSDSVDEHNGRAFSAFYDTDFAEVALQGNLNLGLLVLVTFNRFKNDCKRANYICREFFHR